MTHLQYVTSFTVYLMKNRLKKCLKFQSPSPCKILHSQMSFIIPWRCNRLLNACYQAVLQHWRYAVDSQWKMSDPSQA